MGKTDYQRMIEAFCRQAAIHDVAAVLRGGAFRLHGNAASLRYVETSDLCQVNVDLGASTTEIPTAILVMMLESNCSGVSGYLPFFGLNRDNGHVMLMLHLPLSMLEREENIFRMLEQQFAPVMRAWREFFETVERGDTTQDDMSLPDKGFV
jgi:hypothetical protein